jgi:predicted phosphodiesterase
LLANHGIIAAMRILVISDIHANLAAFEAVLQDAAGQWEQIWCLGDLVGYGPDPNECVALLREHNHLSLSGNHDWAVLGQLAIERFNTEAQSAIKWCRRQINQETSSYLLELPPRLDIDAFTLAHGSPRHPVWEYILDYETAAANFKHFDTPYCLVGHTHAAAIFEQDAEGEVSLHLPVYDQIVPLNSHPLIINPGSVGQPRDADPRAAYGFLDTEAMTWQHCRVAYDVAQTQAKMRQHKLPARLIARLEHGW